MYLLRQCAREPSCAAQRWVEMRHQDPWPVYDLSSGLSSMAGAATATHLLARWIERRCSATDRRYAWLELFLRYLSPVDGMDGAWTLSVDGESSCQAGVVPPGTVRLWMGGTDGAIALQPQSIGMSTCFLLRCFWTLMREGWWTCALGMMSFPKPCRFQHDGLEGVMSVEEPLALPPRPDSALPPAISPWMVL